ncbi:hypothetical protein CEXT_348031, partial [Caerostris extrusa]
MIRSTRVEWMGFIFHNRKCGSGQFAPFCHPNWPEKIPGLGGGGAHSLLWGRLLEELIALYEWSDM